MTTLNRALAFPQIHGIAMCITEHLYLNMPWLFNKFLNEDTIVTKAITRFVLAGHKSFGSFLIVIGNAQALASTAR